MTSDEIKKVREAAEDMLIVSGDVYDDSQLTVANFARSLVGTDGEEPITVDRLREEWGWRSDGTMSMHYDHDEFTALCWREGAFSFVAKCHGMRVYTTGFPITTMPQFRQLAAVLGIPEKKGE